ncbi:MAG: EAL domain-containing protein [Eubacteriales bacterium]|nr:EAL domain-containing protein [Eubacteriales bacterium]
MDSISSGVYIIDKEYNIIDFNETAGILYPSLEVSKKCYKCLMGLESPCLPCPVRKGIKGPRTYFDPIRHIYETVDAVDMPLVDGSHGHALIFSTVGQEERNAAVTTEEDDQLIKLGIIQALSSDFLDVYHFNIPSGQITSYRTGGHALRVNEALDRGYKAAIREYIDYNVHPDDRDYMYAMTDMGYIVKTLKEKESFAVHYRTKRNDGIHHYFVKCARVGAADSFENVVMAFANEDDDILDKLDHEKSLSRSSTLKRQLLIVDDDNASSKMLADILADDYELIFTTDSNNAISILHEHYRSISMILLNIEMRGMNGYQFLESLQGDHFLSNIPIVITAVSDTPEIEEKCLSLGAVDFIEQPFNANLLRMKLKSALRLKESAALLTAIEFDDLTGLYTKDAFIHHAENLIKNNPDIKFNLYIFKLEDMDLLNEQYGNGKVDEVLKYIADSIRSADIKSGIQGRLSASRIICIADQKYLSYSDEEIGKTINIFSADSPIRSAIVKIGIYENINHRIPVTQLIDRTRRSMNKLRNQYQNVIARYDDTVRAVIEKEQRIEACMVEALDQGQFKVYYQPKHSASTGRLTGAEALIRWIHPEYGFMSPADFIPLFEKNGFITSIDRFVAKRVIDNISDWQNKGLLAVPVSINYSRRDLLFNNDFGYVLSYADSKKVDFKLIHVEITESMYVDNQALLMERIRDIRNCGIQIEMDDFGSGYSSLGLIKDMPLDVIKLDMSFMRDFEKQRDIIKLIIDMAHSLGKSIVAEGVETESQLRTLQYFGCDTIQGYYFSKPLPGEEFEEYIRKH